MDAFRCLALAVLPVLVPSAAPSHTTHTARDGTDTPLRFTPREGLELEKHVEIDFEARLVGAFTNGEPSDFDRDQRHTREVRAEVRDRYLDLDGTRLTRFERTYLSATMRVAAEGGDGSTDQTYPSALRDHTVRFDWDAEDEVFEASFPDDDGQPEHLEGILPHLDFADLLPPEGATAGAEWDLAPALLPQLLRPLGEMHCDEPGDLWTPMLLASLGHMPGTLTGTWVETTPRDGRPTALLRFEGDLEATPKATVNARAEGADGEVQVDLELTLEIALRLTADLHWDLEAGHLADFELESDLDLVRTQTAHIPLYGGIDLDQRHDLEARWTVRIAIEDAPPR